MSTRIARIAAVVLGIAVALALLAWYLRDTLIREISNPLLDEYGIVVTDVSLDALATGNARIAHLELTYDNDTIITIDDLTLPIIGTTTVPKTYAARKVSVALADTDDEPLELAPLVENFLSLGDELAGNEFQVAELSVPPYPTVYDLRWTLGRGAVPRGCYVWDGDAGRSSSGQGWSLRSALTSTVPSCRRPALASWMR